MKTALTEHEEQVVRLLEKNMSYSEIAKLMNVTVESVQGAKKVAVMKLLKLNMPDSVERAIRIDQLVHSRYSRPRR